MISLRLLLLLIAVFEFGCRVPAKRECENWFEYEPEIVVLNGRLVMVSKPGPPGFGETPDKDTIVTVPILKLRNPINVRGEDGADLNVDSFANVQEVQLVLGPCAQCYTRYLNKDVEVTGTLFEHQSGHHYTSVLLTMHKIAQDGDSCPP